MTVDHIFGFLYLGPSDPGPPFFHTRTVILSAVLAIIHTYMYENTASLQKADIIKLMSYIKYMSSLCHPYNHFGPLTPPNS